MNKEHRRERREDTQKHKQRRTQNKKWKQQKCDKMEEAGEYTRPEVVHSDYEWE